MESLQLYSSENYLRLSSSILKFEPVSKITNVFFDEANKEVLSVRGGGTLGVVVKSYEKTLTFCMDYKGTISSIKFSPDHSMVAIQRSSSSIELLSCKDGKLLQICTQESRAKASSVLGFIWLNHNELVLVNDQAVECYQVVKEKSTVRFIKSYNQSTKWFVWSPLCQLILLCIGVSSTTASFQPYSFTQGQITKLSKFEVELSGSTVTAQQGNDTNPVLNERDVCIASLYGVKSVLVLRHPTSPSVHAFLDVYSQSKDGVFKKSHICLLELSGKFAVNIVDNLIVVHHQTSKTSSLFDIKSSGVISEGCVSVYPLTMPMSIESFHLEETEDVPTSAITTQSFACPLYASTWVVFQPDIIIDAQLGYMWELHLCLNALLGHFSDKIKLVDCLLRRKTAKPLVLSVVKEEIENRHLSTLGVIFDLINNNYRIHLNSVLQSQIGDCVTNFGLSDRNETTVGSVVIDQAELYSSVFAPIFEATSSTPKPTLGLTTEIMVGIVLEYIRSLNDASIAVPYFVNELVVNGLVSTRQFFQLHQLLQYHVLPDSKPLACILLSLVGVYEAAEQLSLDMLSRLNTAHDEIIEVLLSHKLVIEALKYSQNIGISSSISARKFMEVASATENPLIFYSAYKFFMKRNLTLRGKECFSQGEHCEQHVKHFKELFGDSQNSTETTNPISPE